MKSRFTTLAALGALALATCIAPAAANAQGKWAAVAHTIKPNGDSQLFTAFGRTRQEAVNKAYNRCAGSFSGCTDYDSWRGCRWIIESGPYTDIYAARGQAYAACEDVACNIIQRCTTR